MKTDNSSSDGDNVVDVAFTIEERAKALIEANDQAQAINDCEDIELLNAAVDLAGDDSLLVEFLKGRADEVQHELDGGKGAGNLPNTNDPLERNIQVTTALGRWYELKDTQRADRSGFNDRIKEARADRDRLIETATPKTLKEVTHLSNQVKTQHQTLKELKSGRTMRMRDLKTDIKEAWDRLDALILNKDQLQLPGTMAGNE